MLVSAQSDESRKRNQRDGAIHGVHDIKKGMVRFRVKIDITDDTAARGAMIGEIAERVPLCRGPKARPSLLLLKQYFINSPNIRHGEPLKRFV